MALPNLVSRALSILSGGLEKSLRARFHDGFLCARAGGYDAWGEVEVEIENGSPRERRVDERARLELYSTAGRRLCRLVSEARVVSGDSELEFDGKLGAGGRTRLRCQVVLSELSPGEEVRLRGRLATDGGELRFETPVLTVGNVLPA